MVVPIEMTFKDSLSYLNLDVNTKTELMANIKNGIITKEKVIGMATLVSHLTGKHCLHRVALSVDNNKYSLLLCIEDMSYAIVF